MSLILCLQVPPLTIEQPASQLPLVCGMPEALSKVHRLSSRLRLVAVVTPEISSMGVPPMLREVVLSGVPSKTNRARERPFSVVLQGLHMAIQVAACAKHLLAVVVRALIGLLVLLFVLSVEASVLGLVSKGRYGRAPTGARDVSGKKTRICCTGASSQLHRVHCW